MFSWRRLLVTVLLAGFPATAARLEPTRLAPEASVWFEPNHGQVGGKTDWTTRAAGAWLFLTSNEVVYALPPETRFDPKKTRGVLTAKTTNVHMRIVGGRRVKGVGEKPSSGYSNYFLGKHENEWFSGVPHFGQVRYPEVYPGIDVVYYTTGRSIEYDFIVKPGADPSVIELAFDGTVRVDEKGDLIISAEGKSFRQHRPRVFQGGLEVPSWYEMENGVVRVRIVGFNASQGLTIDPVLDFSTYLGGPGEDSFSSIVIAPDGNPVMAGTTQSPQSPALDPFMQPSVASWAPIVLKMSADGRRVMAYTILGRNGGDGAAALAIDRDGSPIVGGTTRSGQFPLKNAFQTEFKAIWDNAFVAKLTPDFTALVYSSYMGGSNREALYTVTLDDKGNAFFGGGTQSLDYPTVAPIQSSHQGGGNDWFVSRIGPNGALLFSTLFGGDGGDVLTGLVWRQDGALVAVGMSTNGNFPLKDPMQTNAAARVGQTHPVMTLFSTVSNTILYSTYFGDGVTGWAQSATVDNQGRIYVTGGTYNGQFPLKNPIFAERAEASGNGFLTQFQADGKAILFSTYLPGTSPRSLVLDSAENIYVSGVAFQPFPLKNSLQEFRGGGVLDGDHFIMKFSPSGRSIVYSTLVGGRGNELGINLAPSAGGAIYFGGTTGSIDYPIRSGYQPETGGSTDGVFGRITDNTIIQPPPFQVTPPSLSIRYLQGDPTPVPLRLTIASLTQSVTIQSDVDWLRPSPTTLATNGIIQIQPELTRLTPGTHRGTIRIGQVTVEVAATIQSAAPLLSAVEPQRIAIGTDDTEITLRGTGFTNRTTVQLQTNLWQLTPIRFIDSTTLKLTLPKAYFSAEYNHSITVQNPDSAPSKPVSLAVGRPAPNIANKGILSAASYSGDVISPGEILTIFGENFEPGMRVNFDGLLATPLYITPTQLSVVVPPGIAGARETNVIVEMNFDWRSTPVKIQVWPARPGLFTANGTGKGPAAALNENGTINSQTNPAKKGEIIVLWGTGGGVESLPQKVFIDGIETEILYAAGKDGLWQLNVRIPEFAAKGEVVWRAGERESPEGLIVALRE